MPKQLQASSLIILFFILAGCGSASLPKKSAENAGMGVIAVPVEFEILNGANTTKTHTLVMRFSDSNYQPIDKLVESHFNRGKQFAFSIPVEAGTYYLTGYQLKRVNRSAAYGTGDYSMRDLEPGKFSVEVKADTVSVLPFYYFEQRDKHPSGGWTSGFSFNDMEGQALQAFQAEFDQLNNDNQWLVSW